MYDWSVLCDGGSDGKGFQLLLKGCTIEAPWQRFENSGSSSFSCCWKDVRLKPSIPTFITYQAPVSVVVERMYDWSLMETMLTPLGEVSVVVERMYDWSLMHVLRIIAWFFCFSCCWKDVRLKLVLVWIICIELGVSVVVERMYDWSSA